MQLSGDRIVAARLSGRIDFLRLQTYNQGRQIDWSFMSAYRRSKMQIFLLLKRRFHHLFVSFSNHYYSAHVRTGSTGSLSNAQLPSQMTCSSSDLAPSSSLEELRCFLEQQHQGHQQPITCMEVVGNTVLTGSQDHTLKVGVHYILFIFSD